MDTQFKTYTFHEIGLEVLPGHPEYPAGAVSSVVVDTPYSRRLLTSLIESGDCGPMRMVERTTEVTKRPYPDDTPETTQVTVGPWAVLVVDGE